MRSRTSFFNRTIFLKTLTRFWPLWAGYFVLWVLIEPMQFLRRPYIADFQNAISLGQSGVLETAAIGGVILGFGMAALSAMAVWSYLYSARACHGTACLPVRREAVWCSAALAGIAPVVAANALVALLTGLAAASAGCCYPVYLLQWFAIVTLIYLFFFGFAALCAQLTGSVLVLPLVYAVLNFVAVAVEAMVRAICAAFVYGMTYRNLSLTWLSPAVELMDVLHPYPALSEPDAAGNTVVTGYCFNGWGTLGIYAGVGVLLLLAALLLYRRRRMETAGDVVAVKPLKPVFRWCMALGCGLVLSVLMNEILYGFHYATRTQNFLWTLLFLLLGAFVGWFASEMLMKKSFRVFTSRRGWALYGVCCLVILGLMLGMKADLFGYERRVPAPERVASVSVFGNGEYVLLEEPQSVAMVTALHESVVAHKETHLALSERGYDGGWTEGTGSYSLLLEYHLKDGGTLTRNYTLWYVPGASDSGDVPLLQTVLNCPEAIRDRKATDYPITAATVLEGQVSSWLPAAECARLSGYDSAEDYLLFELSGYTRREAMEWSEEERREHLVDALIGNAWNFDEYERWSKYGTYLEPDYEALFAADGRTLKADGIYLPYSYLLTADEALEVYNTCVVPEIDEGALGRVWIITDEAYRREVCAASLSVTVRLREEDLPQDTPAAVPVPVPQPATREGSAGDGYYYRTFTTTPTRSSLRTNAWLSAHGVTLYTYAELG